MLTVHFSLLHPHCFCPGSEQSAPGSRINAEAASTGVGRGEGVPCSPFGILGAHCPDCSAQMCGKQRK